MRTSRGPAWNGFSIRQGQTDWTVWLYSQTFANKKSLERFRLSGQAGVTGFSKPLWWSGWRVEKRPEILQLLGPESGVSLVFIAVVDALEETLFTAVQISGGRQRRWEQPQGPKKRNQEECRLPILVYRRKNLYSPAGNPVWQRL